jgi:hypothetical protein
MQKKLVKSSGRKKAVKAAAMKDLPTKSLGADQATSVKGGDTMLGHGSFTKLTGC